MTKNLKRSGKVLFAAAFVAVLGFGTTQAFADVREAPQRGRCTDGCRALYTRCNWQGGTDCMEQYNDCLETCALNGMSRR